MPDTKTKPEIEETTEEGGEDRRSRRRERLRETNPEKVKRIDEERLTQARDMAQELRHKRGCPAEGNLPGPSDDGDPRVEHFPAKRPESQDLPERERGERLLIVRCIECGESEVAADESEE